VTVPSRRPAVEADAFEDLPIVYEITGAAGITFWEKLEFEAVDRYPHPHLQEPSDFTAMIEAQARAAGVAPDRAKEKIVMRLSLGREDRGT
jgi:hypothetical protein